MLISTAIWVSNSKVTTQITNKLQTYVNRCLQKVMGTRWPEVISDTELWAATGYY